MVTIFVNGQDKTRQISDWKIRKFQENLVLTCYFPSGKSYTRPLNECEITPTKVLVNKLLVKSDGYVFSSVDKVVNYGNKQAVVQYSENTKPYIMNIDSFRLVDKTDDKNTNIFQYFISVAKHREKLAKSKDKAQIAANTIRQLDALSSNSETALHAYCKGESQSRKNTTELIFPFGINESQLEAVEGAFSSQVSLIEGPPGTGKTQTILNIVSNILLRKETVAILSNNNTAVENIYEKLHSEGLDYLVAKLGSTENRNQFFANKASFPSDASPCVANIKRILAEIERLKQFLHAKNEVAKIQAEIDELTIEMRYFQRWLQDNLTADSLKQNTAQLLKYQLPTEKVTDLIAYLTILNDKPISLKNRLELWLNFRILRTRPFNSTDKRNTMTHALQLFYYEQTLQNKQLALISYEEILKNGNFDTLLSEVTASSMAYLKDQLQKRTWPQDSFDTKNYKNKFDTLLCRYPIIGSSTHSIINSLKSGTVLDYVIIDEASQQDIIPGILALGCARNLVIVGDRKQLPAIFTETGLTAPNEKYDCEKYSLLDSCLKVFSNTVPVTLLKEHYRCHPRIIQFCNQQFYNNQLIPMTKDAGEAALKLIITAKGNHTRSYKNQRELDSLLEVLKSDSPSQWGETSKRGFIAPYNEQVALSQSHLPANFIKDTTHKFQGRECDEIIFSTVLDKKVTSQRNLSFVDDPHLINVAVSRAKKQFTLVTGEDVFNASNGPVSALIRYIEYYADDASQIHHSPVISAFDLLYEEYDQSLEKLKPKLKSSDSHYKSEQIIAQLLREQLSLPPYKAIIFHTEIALNQLVANSNEALSNKERGFMKGRTRCDFVLYYKIGKKPLAVIEVDGGDHEKPQQKEWDSLKNSILKKGGLPLLRLKTIESNIEEKLKKFIISVTQTSNT